MKIKKQLILWIAWIILTCMLASYYAFALVDEDKSAFLPGASSSGHYQIELACETCHTDGFGGIDELQKACMKCHGQELKEVDDSHPKSKFTDPRNADRVAILDARYCVTCHKEHAPERTRNMGVTLPDDFCAYCHQDIEEDRESHKDMAFDTCASAGCHNFHDNKALYEDYLVKHGDNTRTVLENPAVIERNFSTFYIQTKQGIPQALSMQDANYPENIKIDKKIVEQWVGTSHAKLAVNCMDCHSGANRQWLDSPLPKSCKSCHQDEVTTYMEGKHGMRFLQGLSPMNTGLARQKLKTEIKDRDLDCDSCHGAHSFDTRQAAIESCLSCHDDDHSKAYKQTQHYRLWQRTKTGALPKEQGVTCATCHLPRIKVKRKGRVRVLVNHNQNHNLRPNEKMIREVCMECHSLRFAIDALADSTLIATNFNGIPNKKIASIDMAVVREKQKAKEKMKKDRKKSEPE